ERGDEAVPSSDAADRLSYDQLLVGGLQRGLVTGGDLLLAVTELRVVLLEHDSLRVERGREILDVVLRGRCRDRRAAQTRVDRDELTVRPAGQRDLVLERRTEDEPALGQASLHPLQERALTDVGRLAVEIDVVGEHGPRSGRVRQNPEGEGVGDEPNLA